VADDDGFLARWARRKAQARAGVPSPVDPPPSGAPPAMATPPVPPAPAADAGPAAPAEPAPTLEDVARLLPGEEVRRFVAPGVDPAVQRAALKKLFADPHFNVMDGLDTYIDDYGRPDPIPLSMLRRLNQSRALGLFDDEGRALPPHGSEPPGPAATDAAEPAATPDGAVPAGLPESGPDHACDPETHEDADLHLQPDDAAGRPGPGAGPRA